MKLEDLNIGDSVTIFSRGEADRIEKITLKTKTLLITSNLSKFNINATK